MRAFLVAAFLCLAIAEEEGIVCPAFESGRNYAPKDNSDPSKYWYCPIEEGATSILMSCEDGKVYNVKFGDCRRISGDRLTKRGAENPKEFDLLEMEAVGDEQGLGALFNARTNTFATSKYLWNANEGGVIDTNTITQPMMFSNLDISRSNDVADRADKLDISADLSIAVLAGKISVEGAAKYLRDDKQSSNTARVVMHYKSTRQSQTMPLTTPIDYPQYCEDAKKPDGVTHVVTSKVEGLRAILKFDRTANSSETTENIYGELSVAINEMPSFQFSGSAWVDIKGKEVSEMEGLHVSYYGDTTINAPTDYKSAIQALNDIQEAAQTASATIRYQLTPLSYLCDEATATLHKINDKIINRAFTILAELKRTKQDIMALMETSVSHSMEPVRNVLTTLYGKLTQQEDEFGQKFQQQIKKLKNGEGTEGEFLSLLGEYDSSAFFYDKIQMFLTTRQREISTLTLILDEVKNANTDSKLNLFKVIDKQKADDIECTSNHDYAYTFNVEVLSKTSSGNAAIDYIGTKQIPDTSNLWYNDLSAVGQVGGQLKAFLAFGKATVSAENADPDDYCFSVNIEEVDEESGYLSVSYFYQNVDQGLWENGLDFTIPGAPPKPVCTSNYNSIELVTLAPLNNFVTEHWAEASSDGNVVSTTHGISTAETITISRLQPNTLYDVTTKYKVLSRRLEKVGFGPSSEKIVCATSPSSPVVNLYWEDNSANKAGSVILYWNKPETVALVDISKLSYVIKVREHGAESDQQTILLPFTSEDSLSQVIEYLKPELLYKMRVFTKTDISRSEDVQLDVPRWSEEIPELEVVSISANSAEFVEKLSLVNLPLGCTPWNYNVHYYQEGSEGKTLDFSIDQSSQQLQDVLFNLTELSAGEYKVKTKLEVKYGDNGLRNKQITTNRAIVVKIAFEGSTNEIIKQQVESFKSETDNQLAQLDELASSERATGVSVLNDNSRGCILCSQNYNIFENGKKTLDFQADTLSAAAKSSCIEKGIAYYSTSDVSVINGLQTYYSCLDNCRENSSCHSVSWTESDGQCKLRAKRRGDVPTASVNVFSINKDCYDSTTVNDDALNICLQTDTRFSLTSPTFGNAEMDNIWECLDWCYNTDQCEGVSFIKGDKQCDIGAISSKGASHGTESISVNCLLGASSGCVLGDYLSWEGCKQCPADTYSDDGANRCTACPTGTGSFAGSSSESQCTLTEGVWGSWTETSSCTVTCGGGTQTFARVCTHHAGVGCQGDATKTVVCGGRECPVDGRWTDWVGGSCSKSCGSGTRRYTRRCIGQQHGGNSCSGDNQKYESCNTKQCPYLVIYKDRGFGGDNQAVTDSIYNLGSNNFGWNDKMGSVKSYRGTWKLYKDTQMKGDSMVVCDGQQYDRVVHDDSYSSIELVNNDSCDHILKIYDNDQYEKFIGILSASDMKFHSWWDNRATSVTAKKGNWKLYEHPNKGGKSLTLCEGSSIGNLGWSKYKFNDKLSSAEVYYADYCVNS